MDNPILSNKLRKIFSSITTLTGNELEIFVDTICKEGLFTAIMTVQNPVKVRLQQLIELFINNPSELNNSLNEIFYTGISQIIHSELAKEFQGNMFQPVDLKAIIKNIMEEGIIGNKSLFSENGEKLKPRLYICYLLKNNKEVCKKITELNPYENKVKMMYHYIEEVITTYVKEEHFEEKALYKRLLDNIKEDFNVNRFLIVCKNELRPNLFLTIENNLKINQTLKKVLNELPMLILSEKRKGKNENEAKVAEFRWRLVSALKDLLETELYQNICEDKIFNLLQDLDLTTWLESLKNEPYCKKIREALFYDRSLEKIICEIKFHIHAAKLVKNVKDYLKDFLVNFKTFDQLDKQLVGDLNLSSALKIVHQNVVPKHFYDLKERLSIDNDIKDLLKSLKKTKNLREKLAKEDVYNPEAVTITILAYNDEFYNKLTMQKNTRGEFDFDKIFKDALMHVNQKKKDGSLENYYEFFEENPKILSLFRKFKAIKQKSVLLKKFQLIN